MLWSYFFYTLSFSQEVVFPNQAQNQSITVDWVVATIQREVITHSDITFELALRPYFSLQFGPIEDRRDNPLLFLIDVKLLSKLGDKIEIYEVPKVELEERLAVFRSQFKTVEAYKHFLAIHGYSEEMLKTHLKSILVAEKVAYRYVITALSNDADERFVLYEQFMKELWERESPHIISQDFIPNQSDKDPIKY